MTESTPSISSSPSASPSSSTVRRKPRPPSVVIETLGATTSETKEGFRKINDYLLKKEIGRGAFGTVHLGIGVNSNTEYAIKEFSKSRLRRKEQSNMLRRGARRGGVRGGFGLGVGRGGPLRNPNQSENPLDLVRGEVAILKKLNHPHVVKLYEVLDDPNGDSIYMVFEMAHKGVLMSIELDHNATPYSNDDARRFFREMILGIEYLHNNDIVHRDIKPDNLLLSDDDVLKIVDFGVSEMFVKGNDKLKGSAGSPAFMAPELCVAHHGEISGKAADIWSLGITLYCLVHGRLPFRSGSIIELYNMIKNDPVTCDENLDPQLVDLLHRLLEKDPEQRIVMSELRTHPWVTKDGQEPLISEEENCEMVVTEVTEEEINNAIKNIGSIFTIMKAVTKFKRHSRSLSQQSLNKIMDEVKKQDEEKAENAESAEKVNQLEEIQVATRAIHLEDPQ
ncbi:kinase-like domain-containing protein [Radiomyces spectabilis]|uniref:kinase-like domain-containing protein n=1 Tax=Radiomyces spectabilis TaxID=64574 RepID=UPI00221EAF3F|nr:kinase-like domain-containing protein [Radiomyces spectabilis]KAI8388599.1 kinase-like domain-containing protein [Radiomyces spectabilis]